MDPKAEVSVTKKSEGTFLLRVEFSSLFDLRKVTAKSEVANAGPDKNWEFRFASRSEVKSAESAISFIEFSFLLP